MSQEYLVLVAGPMGAGKTTAIGTLSEIPVISTEAANSDTASHAKALTTVALDYGEITLGDGDKVRLYGVPGQERFDFMWGILERRALGLMLLLDAAAPEPAADLARFLRVFAQLQQRGALVVGVTRTDCAPPGRIEVVHAALAQHRHAVPVFAVDARDRGQMQTLLATLVALVEARGAPSALQGISA